MSDGAQLDDWMPMAALKPLSGFTVTDADRAAAREAIVSGYNGCQRREFETCKRIGCVQGQIDGCMARVEAVAEAIVAARVGVPKPK